MKQSRRTFMIRAVAGVAAATVLPQVAHATTEKQSESDPYAKSMGFKLNHEEVDPAKYKRWTAEQQCNKCQLWGGKAGDEYGECSFFERYTPSGGWCKNFKAVKKA
jgi:hypothetical protein